MKTKIKVCFERIIMLKYIIKSFHWNEDIREKQIPRLRSDNDRRRGILLHNYGSKVLIEA